MGYIGAGVTRFNTADELTVTGDAQIDGNTLVVDSTNNRVGVGTASPNNWNALTSNLVIEGASDSGITLDSGTASAGRIMFADGTTGNEQYRGYIVYNHNGDNIAIGTAGSERMRITSSGNVGIGEASPQSELHITAANPTIRLEDSDNDGQGQIYGGGGSLSLRSDHNNILANSNMTFLVDGSEAARIDSSQNLLVGKASDNWGTTGVQVHGYGVVAASRNGHVINANRETTDGDIVRFQKNGTTVGNISVKNGDLNIGNGVTGLRINDASDIIHPFSITANASTNNQTDLGTSGAAFKDLYLAGGAYLGGTGSANYLDDYEEGTWTPELFFDGSAGTGVTYDSRDGHYIKVGGTVTVVCNVFLTSKGTSTGKVQIGGLPFSASDNLLGTSLGHSGSIGFYTNASSSIYDLGAIFREGVSYIEIKKKTSATGALQNDAVETDITNTLNIRVSGTYFTNA